MDWRDVVIQIIIPIGLGQIFLRWVFGVILCRYNYTRRTKEIRSTMVKIKASYLEDFARRGLSQSGMRNAAVSNCDTRNKDLLDRLNILRWFGNDAESERIIDDSKKEFQLLDASLNQKYFYYQFHDTLEGIKIILTNSESLQSPMQKKMDSYRK